MNFVVGVRVVVWPIYQPGYHGRSATLAPLGRANFKGLANTVDGRFKVTVFHREDSPKEGQGRVGQARIEFLVGSIVSS